MELDDDDGGRGGRQRGLALLTADAATMRSVRTPLQFGSCSSQS